jgi:transcription antitermination factor NusG
MKEDEFQNIKNKFENPFNVYHYSKRVSDKEQIFKNYYSSHNVMFVADNKFTNYLKNGEFATFKYLYEQIKYTGEVSLFNFAIFLTHNSVQLELSHIEVQKVISIVFWKLVCLDAGINIHTTLPKEN